MRSLVLALVIVFGPAGARALDEPKTGLSITPAAPFKAELTTQPRYDGAIGITSTTGQPAIAGTGAHLCVVGFKSSGANAGMSTEQINAYIERPEWLRIARATLESVFDIKAQTPFMLAGYKGIEFQTVPKVGPNAADVRAFFSLVETQAGRTTMVCATPAKGYEAALVQFRALRGTIVPPK